jgi:hypothetical protein
MQDDDPFSRVPSLTNQEALQLAEGHKGIRDSVEFVSGLPPSKLLGRGILATMHYMLSGLDAHSKDQAENFIEGLVKGSDLRTGSPLHQLRERLMESVQYKTSRLNTKTKIAYFLKAWNLTRRGERVKILAYRHGKKHTKKGREAYPWPI